MKHNNFLTIAIPTKNRSKLLKETLESLISQDGFNQINIVICNNFSKDDTIYVLEEFSRFDNIDFVNNSEPLSIDENMIKVASLVKTEYFLWLGDDDFIKEGKLVDLLKLIHFHLADFFLLNAKFVSIDLKTTYSETIAIQEDIVYKNPKKFFNDHYSHSPFGTLVLKTDLFNSSLNKINKYLNTSHAYDGIVYEYLLEKFKQKKSVKIIVIAECFIFLRAVPKTWIQYSDKIYFQHTPKWYTVLDEYYSPESTEILRTYIKNLFSIKSLVYHRFFSEINLSNFKDNTVYASKLMKLKFIIIVLIPRLNFIKKIFQKKLI
jgi:glycosyltransferase involved in cell wall biosynthesis